MTAEAGSLERAPWPEVSALLRARGMRWTPQRRLLLRVLAESAGHVTAAELIDRCRSQDPDTTPSTVYRTLDVLEDLGLVSHAHGADGHEEYHVLPETDHGHLHCKACGRSWNIEADEAGALVASLRRRRGFAVELSHLSVSGRCADCQERGSAPTR
jgi:Fur family ferric uptake transcriptional regulator